MSGNRRRLVCTVRRAGVFGQALDGGAAPVVPLALLTVHGVPMSMQYGRANGFKIRGLNADCDRLAVQSSEQTTWLLGRKRGGLGLPRWHEVGLQLNELLVLRAYGGAPTFEVQALGDRCGLLVLQQSRGPTVSLRVGSKRVIELDTDESCVIRCEWIEYPYSPGAAAGAYGPGCQL